MKKITLITLLFVFTGSVISGYAAEKPRIGVLRFTNNVGNLPWWTGTARVGRELGDMLSSELVSTKAFQVLERAEIDAVLREQDFSASGQIDPATRVQMGKIKGARYLIAGTVSAFEGGTSGAGARVRIKGISLGGKKTKAYIAVDVKVIDSETGEIIDTRTIEAETKGTAFGAGLNLRDFSLAGGAHKKTAVGKAIRACVIYISEYLACSMVNGQDHSCMKKWNKMEAKRRARTKSVIDID